MLERLHFESRESWLAGRNRQGIGASEAAAVIGVSPWVTTLDLWRQKTGRTVAKDISGNPAVQRGNTMESVLRVFYMGLHPEYELEYHPYDLLYQRERPWLFATLDGELLERETGRRGILEIKTGSLSSQKWSEWKDGNVPAGYFTQTIHQLLATGYDFVRVFGCLYARSGDMTIVEREIEREDHEEDIQWLLQEETRFWRYVRDGVVPPQRLIL